MDHDDEPDDDPRDLAADHHAEWCKDNPLERALEETVAVSAHGPAEPLLDTLAAELTRLRAVADAARRFVGAEPPCSCGEFAPGPCCEACAADRDLRAALAAMRPQPNEAEAVRMHAELTRLRDVAEAARAAVHPPENGWHHCRWCNAQSPDWQHADSCAFVEQRRRVDAFQRALSALDNNEAALAALEGVTHG